MPLSFVYDSTALDFPKTNAVPPGPDPTKEIDAAHWNKICQADYDLRDAIVTGKYFGFTSQASDPTPVGATKYWWLRNDDALILQTPGHTYQIPHGAVTTLGDLLAYNGTKFGVLATGGAGNNGKVLQLDSTLTLGMKWGTIFPVGPTNGGTGLTTYTLGDTLYSNAVNSLAKLAGNTSAGRKFLRQTGNGVVSAAPAWDTLVAGDVPNIAGDVTGAFTGVAVGKIQGRAINAAAPSNGDVLSWVNGSSNWAPTSLFAIFSLFPVGANNFFAGPTNGADAAPGFRALVTADLPNNVVGPLQISRTSYRLLFINGNNGAGTFAANGVKIGDEIAQVLDLGIGPSPTANVTTGFTSVIAANNQIVQTSASNYSTTGLLFLIIAKGP